MLNTIFRKLSTSLYVAFNQNSFNQCLYDYFGHNNNEPRYNKKVIRKMLENYPAYKEEWHKGGQQIYPCAFIIIDKTMECNKIYIEVIPPLTFDEISHEIYRL